MFLHLCCRWPSEELDVNVGCISGASWWSNICSLVLRYQAGWRSAAVWQIPFLGLLFMCTDCMQLQASALVRLQDQPCSAGSRVLAQGERLVHPCRGRSLGVTWRKVRWEERPMNHIKVVGEQLDCPANPLLHAAFLFCFVAGLRLLGQDLPHGNSHRWDLCTSVGR